MAQIEAHHEEAARLDGATLWQMLRYVDRADPGARGDGQRG